MRRWRQLGEILKLVLMSQLLMGLDLPFTQCVLDATGKLVTPGVGSVVNKGRQLPKKDKTKTPTSKLKRSAIKKSLSRSKPAKLKSSSWYDGAARSFKISNEKQPKAR
jgi:hypothetical protein